MNILVCVKRVPDTGAKLLLSEDKRSVDTRRLGFTISPHEECAVEEAVQIIEREGGEGVVLTLGPPEAEEQLRDSLARGMDRAILLEIEGVIGNVHLRGYAAGVRGVRCGTATLLVIGSAFGQSGQVSVSAQNREAASSGMIRQASRGVLVDAADLTRFLTVAHENAHDLVTCFQQQVRSDARIDAATHR